MAADGPHNGHDFGQPADEPRDIGPRRPTTEPVVPASGNAPAAPAMVQPARRPEVVTPAPRPTPVADPNAATQPIVAIPPPPITPGVDPNAPTQPITPPTGTGGEAPDPAVGAPAEGDPEPLTRSPLPPWLSQRLTEAMAELTALVSRGRIGRTTTPERVVGVARVSYEGEPVQVEAVDIGDLDTQPVEAQAATAQPAAAQPAEVQQTPEYSVHVGGNGPLVVMLAMFVVLVCAGAGLFYLLPGDDEEQSQALPAKPAASSAASASPEPSPTLSPSPESSPSPSASPSPSRSKSPSRSPSPSRSSPSPTPTGDATTARVGDCFANVGTDQAPVLQKTTCRPGTVQVLRRFDGTTDTEICKRVSGSDYWYYYGSNTTSFVLCMRKR